MKEMGWSWQDLMSTPVPVVEEIALRLRSQEHWMQIKLEREKQRRGWEEHA
jgi:hypothetical protein